MTEHNELSDIRSILKLWPLGQISSVSEAFGGAVNRVFRVSSSLGVFYLRLYRTSEKQRVLREHYLLEHLAAKNLPAVQTLPSIYGQSIVESEGRFGALYFEAQGQQVSKKDLTVSQAKAAGKMLAQIHFALKDLPDVGYRTYELKWDQGEWISKLEFILKKISEKKISEPSKFSDLDQHIRRRIQSQIAWLQDPDCPQEYIFHSPPQVMHGDYHQENLFFQNATVSSVIDWDQAVYMPRGFEVARVCGYMFDLEKDKSLSFIKAYLAEFPLAADELDDGARAWAAHSDHYLWAAEEIYLNNNRRAQVFIPEVEFFPFYKRWQELLSTEDCH